MSRGDADLHLGHAEFRSVGRDTQIAGGGDLEPGAERVALDARDHWHRQAPDRPTGAMERSNERPRALAVERHHGADVGAADEGATAGAAQDHGAERIVRHECVQCPLERSDARGIEDVELRGIVDGDGGDATGLAAALDGEADLRHVRRSAMSASTQSAALSPGDRSPRPRRCSPSR
jgi:hypothetical protein